VGDGEECHRAGTQDARKVAYDFRVFGDELEELGFLTRASEEGYVAAFLKLKLIANGGGFGFLL